MSSVQSETTNRGIWPSISPYFGPPVAASTAIIPAFKDMRAKSLQQQGLKVSSISAAEWLKGGLKLAPTVGLTIGSQMILQNKIENQLKGGKKSAPITFVSSVITGAVSAPVIAVLNGQSMGWSVVKSLKNFSLKQGSVITAQESVFVASLAAGDTVTDIAKKKYGANKPIEFVITVLFANLGSVISHPANTALTRWQNNMTVGSFRESMLGCTRRMRTVGIFSFGYKAGKEILGVNSEKKDS